MIQAYFEGIKEVIINEVVEAKSAVWLASSYFTDRSMFHVLCALAKKGIEVKLIIADEKVNLLQSDLNYNELISSGGEFYLASRTAQRSLMHHKFCVIDDLKVITGSYNYTLKAQENKENIVVIQDAGINTAYRKEFQTLIEDLCIPVPEWRNEKIASGFIDIDRLTNGFHHGELVCLSGYSGMGMTSLALNMALQMSAIRNDQIGFISTRLKEQQIANRFISLQTGIPLSKVDKGLLEDFEWQLVHANLLQSKESSIRVSVVETLADIELKCRTFAYGHASMIFIDDLDRLLGNFNYDNGSVIEVMERLKNLARQTRVPILFTCTLQKMDKRRTGMQRPLMEDLGMVYNYVDTIILLHRYQYYGIDTDEDGEPTVGTADAIIPKSYLGAEGCVRLKFNTSSLKFENKNPEELKPEIKSKPEKNDPFIIRPSRFDDYDDEPPF